MKTIFSLIVIIFFSACVTPVGDTHRVVDLIIVKTTTPKSSTIAQGITSEIRSQQADLCFNFLHFDVRQPSSFEFNIYSKGTYPGGNLVCPQALYQKDTTLTIPVTVAGSYILKFYNGANLFKSDTVQVN